MKGEPENMLDNIFFRISLRPQAKWAGWPLTKSRLEGRRSKIMLREDVDPAWVTGMKHVGELNLCGMGYIKSKESWAAKKNTQIGSSRDDPASTGTTPGVSQR